MTVEVASLINKVFVSTNVVQEYSYSKRLLSCYESFLMCVK